jgi:hypothetical protein
MIETNADSTDVSLVVKGRQFLERGDISSAVECYGKAFDPDTVDEAEARTMLIEARSHLSRKRLLEALECFEEALVMGTEVQRRQALEGISAIGEVRSKLRHLTPELKKGIKQRFGKRSSIAAGMALVSDEENVVILSEEAIERLPTALAKSTKISRLPQHLLDQILPIRVRRCIPYSDEEDVRFVLEVATSLAGTSKEQEDV